MKIKLFDESERVFLDSIARSRAKGKTHLKTKSLMCAGRKDGSAYDKSLEGHYMGVAGEYALAEELKGFMDFIPRSEGDKHAADILCRDKDGKNCKVSVKTTKYKDPILKVNSLAEIKDATHIALCRYFKEPNQEGVEMHWVKSVEEFEKSHYIRDFGYGPKMCLK